MEAALFFIVKTLLELYLLTFLLRFLLQWVRADFHNPLSQFIVRVTNPVVRPLRRVIPSWRGLDMASLVALLVLQLIVTAGIMYFAGHRMDSLALMQFALMRTAVLVIRFYFFAILVYAILSWVSPGQWNPLTGLLASLTEPVLAPVRRFIPPIGGLDLSPLFVLIGLQALLLLFPLPGYLS
ncbi:MAG: YggT family protein [Gammaproteobacteria bacterium]